jgi:cytochrome c-type biogenesis protein CcmH/NrfG
MRQAYYQLGRAYQALGRASDAEAAFARAQELAREGRDLPEGLVEPRPDAR